MQGKDWKLSNINIKFLVSIYENFLKHFRNLKMLFFSFFDLS